MEQAGCAAAGGGNSACLGRCSGRRPRCTVCAWWALPLRLLTEPAPAPVPQAALCRIPRRRLSAAEARGGAGPLAVASCAICLNDWRKGDDVRELKVRGGAPLAGAGRWRAPPWRRAAAGHCARAGAAACGGAPRVRVAPWLLKRRLCCPAAPHPCRAAHTCSTQSAATTGCGDTRSAPCAAPR